MDGTYFYAHGLERPPLERIEERLRAELRRARTFLPDDPLTAHSIALQVQKQLSAMHATDSAPSALLVQTERLVERSRDAARRFREDAERRNRAFHERQRRELATPLERLRRPVARDR